MAETTTNYVILEAQRQTRSGNNDESIDLFKNKWVNNVNSSGLEINIGDTISIAGAAINSVGASDNVLEFTGIEGKDYFDNKAKLEFSYYVNHTGINTAPLPFRNTKTFHGNFKTSGTDNATPFTTLNQGDLTEKKNLLARTIGNPDLGGFETGTYDATKRYNRRYEQQLGPTITTEYEYPPVWAKNYTNYGTMPDNSLVCRMGTTSSQIIDPQPGTGYTAGYKVEVTIPTPGTTYNAMDGHPLFSPWQGQPQSLDWTETLLPGWYSKPYRRTKIQVLGVGPQGEVTQWKFLDATLGPQGGPTSNQDIAGQGTHLVANNSPTGGGIQPGTGAAAWFRVTAWINQGYPGYYPVWNSTKIQPGKTPGTPSYDLPWLTYQEQVALGINFATKKWKQPDNERYYFGPENWAGIGAYTPIGTLDSQIYNVGANDGTTIHNYTQLTSEIAVEIPVGFNSPSTIAQQITDQLHQPTIDNANNELYTDQEFDFVDLTNYNITAYDNDAASTVPVSRGSNQPREIVKPTAITTNTYKPHACNFAGVCNKTIAYNNLTGARNLFWSNIAVKEPDKWEGLSYTRNFAYETAASASNEILSGDPGYTQSADVGDLNTQTVGSVGMNQCFIGNLPFTNQFIDLGPNAGKAIFVTNVYYTKANVEKIAKSFRIAEKYWGDLTETIGEGLSPDNYGVGMDIGLYNDQQSAAELYDNRTTNTNLKPFYLDVTANDKPNGQRFRFCTINEMEKDTLTQITRETHLLNAARVALQNKGTQLDGTPNDGQQLNQIVFKSRYDPDFNFNINPLNQSFADFIDWNNTAKSNGSFSTGTLLVGEAFGGGYNGNNKGARNYNEEIGWAIENDVCVIPVYTSGAGGWEGNSSADGKYLPLLAYVSKFNIDPPTSGGSGPPWNPQTRKGNWVLDEFNMPMGVPLGLDTSFIRNDAVAFYNLQTGDIQNFNSIIPESYNTMAYIGAVNPEIVFDSTLGRFSLQNLSTGLTIGNVAPEQPPESVNPNSNPEQQVFATNKIGAICPFYGRDALKANGTDTWYGQWVSQFRMQQKPGTLLDGYGGIAVKGLSILNIKKEWVKLNPLLDQSKYINSLFYKIGFNLNQLLPLYGSTQTQNVAGTNLDDTNISIERFLLQNSKPMTTGAYISSAEFQALDSTANNLPQYGMGGDQGFAFVEPDVSSGTITATRAPSKLDYSYINIYSSIIQGGTNGSYYGGSDGKSQLPCVAFATRYYAAGDYFFDLGSDFSFTAQRNYTLTDITTELRLPDSSRPILGSNSSVIYKITKAEPIPAQALIEQQDREQEEEAQQKASQHQQRQQQHSRIINTK